MDDTSNDLRAARALRVLASADLADVSPEDIDAFLDTVACPPLPEDAVVRILRAVRLGPSRAGGSGRTPPGGGRGEPAPGRLRAGRLRRRLACEELEQRQLPSLLGPALDGPVGDPTPEPPASVLTFTVRVWHEGRAVEKRGAVEPTTELWTRSILVAAIDPAALTTVTLNSVFASGAYQCGAGFDGLGAVSEDLQAVLATNLLSVPWYAPCPDVPQLQLAG